MHSGSRAGRAISRWLGILIIACMGLTGCAIGPFGVEATPPPAPSLHLRGVTEVASVYAFRLNHPTLDEILIGSALLPDAAGVLRPYLVLRPDHDLYAVRPDGSDLHRILIQQSCFLSHVGSYFSPDGQWMLCGGGDDVDLQLSGLGRGEETSWTLIPVTVRAEWWALAWSPNGRQVAAPMAGTPCTVGLFDLTLTPPSVRLSRTLVLPELTSSQYCFVSWSPNGRYLALSEDEDYYRVDLAALPAPDATQDGAPSVTVSTAHTPDALQYLVAYDSSINYSAVWLGDGSALVINEQGTLLARGVSGGPSQALLQVPFQQGNRLCVISNIPQTVLVAFSYCHRHGIDADPDPISGPGERLYVFDPATA